MTLWKYKVVYEQDFPNTGREILLNKLGAEGWELITMMQGEKGTEPFWVLKREKESL